MGLNQGSTSPTLLTRTHPQNQNSSSNQWFYDELRMYHNRTKKGAKNNTLPYIHIIDVLSIYSIRYILRVSYRIV